MHIYYEPDLMTPRAVSMDHKRLRGPFERMPQRVAEIDRILASTGEITAKDRDLIKSALYEGLQVPTLTTGSGVGRRGVAAPKTLRESLRNDGMLAFDNSDDEVEDTEVGLRTLVARYPVT
jgi:hypothetical protein